jgi:hypothetical protein
MYGPAHVRRQTWAPNNSQMITLMQCRHD